MFSAKKAKEKSSCPRNTRKDTKIFRDKRQSVMAAGPCLLWIDRAFLFRIIRVFRRL